MTTISASAASSAGTDATPSIIPSGIRALAPAAIVVVAATALPRSLSANGRIAPAVCVLCIVGWTLTRLPDSVVALGGALALVTTGVLGEDRRPPNAVSPWSSRSSHNVLLGERGVARVFGPQKGATPSSTDTPVGARWRRSCPCS